MKRRVYSGHRVSLPVLLGIRRHGSLVELNPVLFSVMFPPSTISGGVPFSHPGYAIPNLALSPKAVNTYD